jgi:hypothetical protein
MADTGLTVERGRPSVRVASLETTIDSDAAGEEEATHAAATHDASFNERFASSFDERSTSAFKKRFAASFDEPRGEAAETLAFAGPPMPLVGALPEPLKSFAMPQDTNSALVPDAGRHESVPPAVGRTGSEPTVARTPLPAAFGGVLARSSLRFFHRFDFWPYGGSAWIAALSRERLRGPIAPLYYRFGTEVSEQSGKTMTP